MKIVISLGDKSPSLRFPTRLLLNNCTVLFLSRRLRGYVRFRALYQLKKTVYKMRKEYPDWRLVEVAGKDGKEKVSVRL